MADNTSSFKASFIGNISEAIQVDVQGYPNFTINVIKYTKWVSYVVRDFYAI